MTQNRPNRKGPSVCIRCGANVKNNSIKLCKACREKAVKGY